jgi:hypothetical protein
MNESELEPCELASIVHKKPLSGVYVEKLFGSAAGNTLWVKFSDMDGIDEWIGKFGTGGSASARVDKVIEPDKFLISTGGFGYLVDATKRELLNHHFEAFTQDVAYDSKTNRFIVADCVRLRLIEAGKVVFSSKRIAIDGIRDLKIQDRLIRGLAVTGFEGEESEFTFDIDKLEIKCLVDLSAWDNITTAKPKQAVVRRKFWWKFW